MANKYDIFLSYSHKDYELAKKIGTALIDRGYSVFIDVHDLDTGHGYFEEALLYTIKSCKFFFPIVTEAYLNSPATSWLSKQLSFAQTYGKVVLPISLGRAMSTPHSPNLVDKYDFLVVNEDSFDLWIDRIDINIKEIIKLSYRESDEAPDEEDESQGVYKLKFENNDHNDITVSIDGEETFTLAPDKVKVIERTEGKYVVSTTMDCTLKNKMDLNFNSENHGNIIHLQPYSQHNNNQYKRYKCFIAGSTTIVNERNAAISRLSKLQNDFLKKNIIVSAYTYENFSNRQTYLGHQPQYDKFIQEEAHSVIFIICDGVGKKTKDEYDKAMDAYKLTGHPSIYVFCKIEGYDQNKKPIISSHEVREFIAKCETLKNYVIFYQDINTLMLLLESNLWKEIDEFDNCNVNC